MANEKELNPSPAEVEGEFKQVDVDARLGQEWGTLSPNPALEEKLEKGEHGIGTPTNPNFNDKVEPEPIKTKNEVIRLIQQYGGGGGEPVDLSDYAKIHSYAEGTVLTDEILAEIKSGDILKVGGLSLLVTNAPNLSPRAITSKRIAAYDKYWDLNWEYGEELELNLVDIGAKEPTVAYEGVSNVSNPAAFADWTLHRAIKDGNILWVVVSGQIKSQVGAATVYGLCTITLPEEISSKIYRYDGTPCNQNSTNDSMILRANGTVDIGSKLIAVASNNANEITVGFATEGVTVSSGGTVTINFRVPLFLDIGTNA